MIELVKVKQNHPQAREYITNHYIHPRGFIGRNVTYLIVVDGETCGVIVGGSTSLHLPNRKEFFGECNIQDIINNRLFRLEKNIPNLGTQVLKLWRKQVVIDWKIKYNSDAIGFETLVRPPLNGAVYRADNWILGGMTKGYTCKVPHHRTRVWYKTEPRLVFYKRI
jgi:hypothetical protein